MNTPRTDILRDKFNADLIGRGDLLSEYEQLEQELNEAQHITSFALDKDYYEKYQKFCAELEVVKQECDTLRKVCADQREALEYVVSSGESYERVQYIANNVLEKTRQ